MEFIYLYFMYQLQMDLNFNYPMKLKIFQMENLFLSFEIYFIHLDKILSSNLYLQEIPNNFQGFKQMSKMSFLNHFQLLPHPLVSKQEYFFLLSTFQPDLSTNPYPNHFYFLLNLHFFKISNSIQLIQILGFQDQHFQIYIYLQFLLFFYYNSFWFFKVHLPII